MDLKQHKKYFSSLGLRFFIGGIVIYAAQIIAAVLVMVFNRKLVNNGNAQILLSLIPMYLIGIPVLALLVTRMPAEPPLKRDLKPSEFICSFLMGYSLMIGSNLIVTVIGTIIDNLIPGADTTSTDIGSLISETSPWLLCFCTVICAPLIEEFVFRKLIVDRTARQYGEGTAVVLSGLMFGLFHGNASQGTYATFLGFILAYLYARTGKLKVTIAIHMIVNFLGSFAALFLMKMLNLDDSQMDALLSGDTTQIASIFMDNLGVMIFYIAYIALICCMVIAGFVILIVFLVKKKFVFAKGRYTIPKGKRFSTVILNVGMILFFLFHIGEILVSMFQNILGDVISNLVTSLTGG